MVTSPSAKRRYHCARTFALLLGFFLAAVTTGVGADPPSKVLLEGEELVYNVRYAFFDLGQIRIKILAKSHEGSAVLYSGKALIDSYPRVPFVELHAVFESLIDSNGYSRRFAGRLRQDDFWDFSRYRFEYDKNLVYIEMGGKDTVVVKRDTLSLEGKKFQDGLSLFFQAREQLFSRKGVNIPTLIKEKKVNTFINFLSERTSVEIDAIDYPVDVMKFEGMAEFVGIFGLTGDFSGWFSNDEARVPIMAKMQVILGSVTIELMEWKRAGWTPPRATE
jgi:hypothetical protein